MSFFSEKSYRRPHIVTVDHTFMRSSVLIVLKYKYNAIRKLLTAFKTNRLRYDDGFRFNVRPMSISINFHEQVSDLVRACFIEKGHMIKHFI